MARIGGLNARMTTPLLLILGMLLFSSGRALAAERPRIIVETDAGGDPDDEQSLVRLLLYANEFDIEGIIANRARAREGENKNSERTGVGIVRRLVAAYAQCHPNLLKHDPQFANPAALLGKTVPGHNEVEDGVRLIISAVDSNDPRPIWFMNWGTDDGSGESCLKRALDQVLAERGAEGYAKFKARLRLSSADKFGAHTMGQAPPFSFWVDTFRPPIEGKRWYHRFSARTARAGGFDIARDALAGHGPLGALYPTNTTHWLKEGDTMTFLYLIPTGMNDPDQPGWGSWAGRYGPQPDAGGRSYFWANQADAWNGSTNRDNTLARWAADLQNDFAARLDWCVKPFASANHKPRAALNGDSSLEILRLKARAGTAVRFSAEGSSDPDGHRLSHEWLAYPEAGTFRGALGIENAFTPEATVRLPPDAAGKEIHLLLILRDNGTPALASYRRAVIQVE